VQKGNEWVCGGYNGEIDLKRSNGEIPREISDAVKQGDFAISNYNPPQPQEIALIARDLGQYSVLAVATRQIDDKGRDVTGYRYFWCKPPARMDGVGSILLWWWRERDRRQLYFNMNPVYIVSTVESLRLIEPAEFREKYDQNINSSLWERVKHHSCFEPNSHGQLDCHELHCLALSIDNRPCWAWNVRKLEHPERFHVIYCADFQALNRISNDINRAQRDAVSKSNINSNRCEIPQEKITEIKTEIKKCVSNVYKKAFQKINADYYFTRLVYNLRDYPTNDYQWESLCDRKILERFLRSNPMKEEIRYAILWEIILPGFLNEIYQLGDSPGSLFYRKNRQVAREFLKQINQEIEKHKGNSVYPISKEHVRQLLEETENPLSRAWKKFITDLKSWISDLVNRIRNLWPQIEETVIKAFIWIGKALAVIGGIAVIAICLVIVAIFFYTPLRKDILEKWPVLSKLPFLSVEKPMPTVENNLQNCKGSGLRNVDDNLFRKFQDYNCHKNELDAIIREHGPQNDFDRQLKVFTQRKEDLLNLIKDEYIPDSTSEHADDQAKIVFDFLLQTEDDKSKFDRREKHVQKCKKEDSGQFWNCIREYNKID